MIGFISLFLYSPALADTLQGKVVKFADGDTVTIVDDLGDKHRIRLAGIDAPEKDQPYGLESTKNLERLINSLLGVHLFLHIQRAIGSSSFQSNKKENN